MTKQHSDGKKRHSPTIGHSKSKHVTKETINKDVEQGRESPVISPPSVVEEREVSSFIGQGSSRSRINKPVNTERSIQVYSEIWNIQSSTRTICMKRHTLIQL